MTPRTPKLFGFQTRVRRRIVRFPKPGPPPRTAAGPPVRTLQSCHPNEVKNEFTQSCHSERSEESALLSLLKPCHPERNGVFAQSARTPRSRRTPTPPVAPRSSQGVLPSVPTACEHPEVGSGAAFVNAQPDAKDKWRSSASGRQESASERQGHSVQRSNRPTQAKVGLEGRPDERPATGDRWLAAIDKNASPRPPSDAIMLATCALAGHSGLG